MDSALLVRIGALCLTWIRAAQFRSLRSPTVNLLMRKKFIRNYKSLEDIFEFTEQFFNSEGIGEAVRFPVHFVLEELFTNMVKYNPDNSNEILLDVNQDNERVTVSLTDYDVDSFDVTKRRDVDIESPLQQRKVGGLGLHLIQKMVDSLEYKHSGRQSNITFTKGLA